MHETDARVPARSAVDLERMRRLASIVENTDDAILGKTLDGTITDWNPGAERMYGYSRTEMLGQNVRQLVPEENRHEIDAIHARIARGEAVRQHETIRVRRDGRRFHALITVSPITDDAGCVIGASAICRDISRRVLAEEALARNEERWQLALDCSGSGAWDWDIASGGVIFSVSWQKMLGLPPQPGPTAVETWSDRLHPDDRAQTLAALDRCLKGNGDEFEQEYRLRREDSTWIWVLDRGLVVRRNAQRLPERIVGAVRDITERRKLIDALRQSEENADALMNAITESTLLIDDDGIMLRVNRTVAERLRSTPEALVGRDFAEFLEPEVAAGRWELLHQVFTSRQPVRSKDYRFGRIIDQTVYPVIESDGSVHRAAIFARDVTEEVRAQEALADRTRELETLFQTVQAGIVIMDAQSLLIEDINPVALQLFGRTRNEVIGQPCHAFLCGAEQSLCPYCHSRDSETGIESTFKNARGETVSVLKAGRRFTSGGHERIIESFVDISDRKRREDELLYEATHDALTGLCNRAHLLSELDRFFAESRRYSHALSVCLCDIDHFKTVNDTHGHPAGDEVLRAFASMLRRALRVPDFAGRYGGDEFVLVFPHTPVEGAALALERILQELRELEFRGPGGDSFLVTGSFGVVQLDRDHANSKALLAEADDALYQAKRAGRNRVYAMKPQE